MKKNLFCAAMLVLAAFVFAQPVPPQPVPVFNTAKAVTDTGEKPFNGKDAAQTVKDMRTGWNLGNTMDTVASGLNAETTWAQPKTTKKMIDGLAESGIKTIRIPTTWVTHLIDKKYTIDPAWMARVKQIVDWAIEDDMYVILNSHWDNYGETKKIPYGKGYYPSLMSKGESEKFLLNVWSQICLAFNNGYDEHLIFETLNEPHLTGTKYEWWYDKNAEECRTALEVINGFNQLIVNTIRASGGNNQKRFIMCPPYNASPDAAFTDEFVMPEDDEPGKLIVAVHMYSPYEFAMGDAKTTKFTDQHKAALDYYFDTLNEKFVQNGYPVVIGEYGATNKNNLEARTEWFRYFLSRSRRYGITAILWDNGQYQVKGGDVNEKFGYYNRTAQKWYFPEILEAIVEETK